jgi:hypothetical protein
LLLFNCPILTSDTPPNFLTAVLIFGILLCLWQHIKINILNYFSLNKEVQRLKRIVLDKKVFLSLLQKSRKVSNLPVPSKTDNHLVLALSLSCVNCKKLVDEICNPYDSCEFSDSVSITFIIYNSKGLSTVSEFNEKQFELNTNKEKLLALHRFFRDAPTENNNFRQTISKTDKLFLSWLAQNDIMQFPQIIYNNTIVPKSFSTQEIISFIFKPVMHV